MNTSIIHQDVGVRLVLRIGVVAGLAILGAGCAAQSGRGVGAFSLAGADSPSPWDLLVAEAVDAALLRDVGALQSMSERAKALEKSAARGEDRRPDGTNAPGADHAGSTDRLGPESTVSAAPSSPASPRSAAPAPHLQDQLRLLALLVNSPPLPTAKEARKSLSGTKLDEDCRAVVAMLQLYEPRSRLAEAQKSARYRALTGPVNAVVQTGFRVLQGELYALVEGIAGGVESLFRRPYLTPAKREVLRARRDVLAAPLPGEHSPALRKAVDKGLEARLRLARLQAVETGDRAADQGRLETALWWYGRARRIDPDSGSVDRRIRRVSARLNGELQTRQESLGALNGEDFIIGSDEKILYAALLRACIDAPDGEEAVRLRQEFLSQFPFSAVADEVRLNEVAARRVEGKPDAGRVLADWLARHGTSDSSRARAAFLARDPRFSPPAEFKKAISKERKEFWGYLFFGDKPARLSNPSPTCEQARRGVAGWLRPLSPVFVTDVLNRLISLPFSDPLDHGPSLDAAGRWTPPPPDDPQAEERARARAEALYDDNRFNEAERAFLALDPPDPLLGAKSREKAARQRFKQIERLSSPAFKVEELRTFLNAYPNTRMAVKARRALEAAEARADVFAAVPKSELCRAPALFVPEALDFSSSIVDGESANGELGDAGVEIHVNRTLRCPDAKGVNLEGRTLTVEQLRRTLAVLEAVRRPEKLSRERDRRKRLYSVPLQVEGTAFPGFEVAPGLAPPREVEGVNLFE